MRKRRIIPLLVARWSSPLPGPICFHAPRFVEPAETMHGARAHAAAASRTAERQNLRLSRHPVTSLAANARFRQPTLLNQDWHAPPHAASSVGQQAIRRDERPADGRRGLPSRRRVFAGRVDLSYVNPGLTANANLCAVKTPVWQSRPDLAMRSEAATKRELGLRLADPREGASGAIEGRRRLPNRRFCSTSYGEAVRRGIAEPSEGRLGRESTPMTISKRLQRAARPRQPA